MAASLKVLSRLIDIDAFRTLSRHKICSRHVRLCSQSAARSATSRTWQLHSAVCLQRYPVITQEMTEIEQRYKTYLESVETTSSYLSNHELQVLADIERMKQVKEEQDSGSRKVSKSEENISTARELEDEWQRELNEFTPADRLTAADHSGDMTTSHRRLDRQLVLIVKQRFDGDSEPIWGFPQIQHQDGESMRQSAERALSTCCGEDVQATFIGNAPCGYYKYRLPVGQVEEYGVKVFFFKAAYSQGDVMQMDNITEHKWVTLDEVKDYIDPNVMDDMKDFLVEF